ncbi:NADAR family protein [Actinomadura sp. 7K507]|uniref:NADAR family protein n=1 Tax=Actinomadura sp. 7K507 TaxID=2530365 RepID=UPI0010531B2A|nr:NADAR family protein [Actinomadura sp. 7K507]TDC75295.1 NADAR family protein [Actinomadura sp. 7K507]
MVWRRPTYRLVDGERVDGVWCHVWIKSYSGYYVDDLFAYADGLLRCGEVFDLRGLRQRLESGKIVLRDPERPVPERPAPTPRWSARYPEPLTNQGFLGEVADEIEALNGRPTTSDRCWEAIRRYQSDPAEDNRVHIREAYLAIPAHRRVFVLGDMDLQDIPLRQLVTDIGEPVGGDGPIATAEMHSKVLEYFNAGDQGLQREREHRDVLHADDPVQAGAAAITLHERVNPLTEPPEHLDLWVLRNEFPAPFTFAGQTYPTIIHGYWASAVAARSDHDRIRDAATVREAHETGGRCTLRPDWAAARTAVMAGLLRAKFTQHPELAEILLSTADARISYTGISESPFWTDRGPRGGRNWVGRLLELVRAELLQPRH